VFGEVIEPQLATLKNTVANCMRVHDFKSGARSIFDVRIADPRAKETRMKTGRVGALLLVVSSVALVATAAACGGDNKNPSPGPSGTSTPASGDGGSSSSSEGPKTASTGAGTSGDGGVKGDSGYFAGGSALPQ
jgi:hypothetical protein